MQLAAESSVFAFDRIQATDVAPVIFRLAGDRLERAIGHAHTGEETKNGEEWPWNRARAEPSRYHMRRDRAQTRSPYRGTAAEESVISRGKDLMERGNL